MMAPGDDDGPPKDRRERSDPPSWRPVPDPTRLTTEALHREVAALRELIEERIAATDALVNEKFSSVDRQLSLVERQRVEQKSDTEKAVNAALVAQKDAVKEQTIASEKSIEKSEASTNKQLEQITVTFSTALAGLNAQLDDIKARVVTIEAVKQGSHEQAIEQREGNAALFAVAGLLLTAILVATAVLALKP
jgi:hypothetical protein